MPQMSPMNWLVLLLVFNFTLLITSLKINFFMKTFLPEAHRPQKAVYLRKIFYI